jgi:hypothetical protein
VIASILVAMIASDRFERRVHAPVCIEACENAGLVFAGVPHPELNSIRCDCRSTDGVDISPWAGPGRVARSSSTLRVSMSWSEYEKWHAVTAMIAVGLLGVIGGVKWLWRRQGRSPDP